MLDAQFDLTLPHDYDVTVVRELPGRHDPSLWHDFPLDSGGMGQLGLLLRVESRCGAHWFGQFRIGYWDKGFTGVFSCPDPRWMCVVCGGGATIVDTTNPLVQHAAPTYSVTSVHVVTDPPLLIFADFNKLSAWGMHGELWRTADISIDGIHMQRIEDGWIVGEADDPTGPRQPFRVRLSDGHHEGGSSFGT
jgi:hypothetical protein